MLLTRISWVKFKKEIYFFELCGFFAMLGLCLKNSNYECFFDQQISQVN